MCKLANTSLNFSASEAHQPLPSPREPLSTPSQGLKVLKLEQNEGERELFRVSWRQSWRFLRNSKHSEPKRRRSHAQA